MYFLVYDLSLFCLDFDYSLIHCKLYALLAVLHYFCTMHFSLATHLHCPATVDMDTYYEKKKTSMAQ